MEKFGLYEDFSVKLKQVWAEHLDNFGSILRSIQVQFRMVVDNKVF
jgi:hypothetical protein